MVHHTKPQQRKWLQLSGRDLVSQCDRLHCSRNRLFRHIDRELERIKLVDRDATGDRWNLVWRGLHES